MTDIWRLTNVISNGLFLMNLLGKYFNDRLNTFDDYSNFTKCKTFVYNLYTFIHKASNI
jgi:hypothetical protein